MSDNEEFESSESEEEESEEEESEDGDSAEGESFLSEGNHGFVFRVFFFSQNWTFLLLLYASKNTRKRKTKVTGRLKIVCSF